MQNDPAERLRQSWEANAAAWSRAIAEGAIASRVSGTDAAIVRAALERSPGRVLDLGCGEGWLARELSAQGVEVVGIDASAELIRIAAQRGGARFHQRSYSDFAANPVEFGRFDLVVANFALLQDDIAPLLHSLHRALRGDGTVLIQTVHPWAAKGAEPYQDGWRTETFAGFVDGFPEAMPWYFRTLASWIAVLREAGFRLLDLKEPSGVDGDPLSLLLAAGVERDSG